MLDDPAVLACRAARGAARCRSVGAVHLHGLLERLLLAPAGTGPEQPDRPGCPVDAGRRLLHELLARARRNPDQYRTDPAGIRRSRQADHWRNHARGDQGMTADTTPFPPGFLWG